MIKLSEIRPPIKQCGLNSIKVEFNYSREIVDAIKQVPNAIYHKKLQCWEIPTTSLARAIETLHNYDDIKLNLLQDIAEVEDTKFTLQNYKTKPFDYQEEGIQYLLNHHRSLLLDAPGLGKTLQLTYVAQELKERYDIQHCLIICGINTLKFNWKKEIEKHSDLSCRILGQRINRKGKLIVGSVKERIEQLKNPIDEFFVITNVESLRDDNLIKELTKGKANTFDMIVVDEIHKMKGSASQQGKNLLKLSASFMYGLTGTLLLNTPLDAYVPLKWIGVEQSTKSNFEYYYCNYTGPFNNILLGYKNIDVLKDEIERYSLRRTKDILNLPPKNIIHEHVEMDNKQATFYENIVNGIVNEVDKVHINTSTILSMCTRLRQVTASPSILTSENIGSSKLDRVEDLVEEITNQGDKVVVFSVFKEPLNVLNERLTKYNPLLCTGDIDDTTNDMNVVQFQENDYNKVMLATCQKMGTGITLTAATYAIFIDCPWTAAECTQCEDRIYRIGSDRPVFIYYLWNTDTIDERVKEIVSDKEAISDFVIDNKVTKKGLESLKKYIIDLS